MTIFKLAAYVGIILIHNNQVVLVQRYATDWMGGYWNFPGGLVEQHETILQAAIRETEEEVGVTVDPKDFTLVHVIHVHANGQNTKDIMGFYFMARSWKGTPVNNEPDHHSALGWFDINVLPSPITDHALLALKGLKTDTMYSEHGW